MVNRAHPHVRRFPLLGAIVLACAVLVGDGASALAAKWTAGCPRKREKLRTVGHNIVSPIHTFVHIGHEVTYRVKKISTDDPGFSTAPDAYTVEVTFEPVLGAPIPLPPFTATAVSQSTLKFVFPDPTTLIGRMVVGRAWITVQGPDAGTGWIATRRQKVVVLPPPNDVHALIANGEIEALGAVGFSQRMWIPLHFGGFGQGAPMPSCPAEMTPIVRFALDFTLKKGDDEFIPHTNFATLRKSTYLFLGDFVLDGVNVYGARIAKSPILIDHTDGGGFVICNANDTLDMVVMVKMLPSAFNEGSSDLGASLYDGSPFVVKFRNLSADPMVASQLLDVTTDSLGYACPATP